MDGGILPCTRAHIDENNIIGWGGSERVLEDGGVKDCKRSLTEELEMPVAAMRQASEMESGSSLKKKPGSIMLKIFPNERPNCKRARRKLVDDGMVVVFAQSMVVRFP